MNWVNVLAELLPGWYVKRCTCGGLCQAEKKRLCAGDDHTFLHEVAHGLMAEEATKENRYNHEQWEFWALQSGLAECYLGEPISEYYSRLMMYYTEGAPL